MTGESKTHGTELQLNEYIRFQAVSKQHSITARNHKFLVCVINYLCLAKFFKRWTSEKENVHHQKVRQGLSAARFTNEKQVLYSNLS